MYIFDNDNKEMTKSMKKPRNYKGELNPHFGHKMQSSSREAIAKSQRARYDYYRKAAANMMTENRVREIITETINDYFARNTTEVKNNKPNNIPL